MTLVHYTARVTQERLLELPPEAQKHLEPGQEVCLQFDPVPLPASPRNEMMLAFVRDIQERHRDRPDTDGSHTPQLLREARGGAMYDRDPTE